MLYEACTRVQDGAFVAAKLIALEMPVSDVLKYGLCGRLEAKAWSVIAAVDEQSWRLEFGEGHGRTGDLADEGDSEAKHCSAPAVAVKSFPERT